MTNPRRSRTLLRTAVIAAGGLALAAGLAGAPAGCGSDGRTCSNTAEIVHLKIDGTCPGRMQEFDLEAYGCSLSVRTTTGPLGLPPEGAVDGEIDPIRRGGWQLYGCLSGTEPCPGSFRRCVARRVDFHLDVSCIDGSGAPVCDAVLTE